MRTIFAFVAAISAMFTSYGYAEHVVIEERPIIEERVHVHEAPVVVVEHPHHHHYEVEEKVVEVR